MKERESRSSGSHFHESYYEHTCTVATERDVLWTDIHGQGWRPTFRRWWHDWFLLSYGDERCSIYYASSNALRIERARQFRRYRSRIHPLSKFSRLWGAIILLASIVNRIIFHHNTSLTYGKLNIKTHIIGIFMEIILLVDPIVHLMSGYINQEQRIIVLNPKKNAVNYCSTKLFFHVVSALPLQCIMLLRYGLQNCSLCRGNIFVSVLQLLSVFALFRVFDTTKYVNNHKRFFRNPYVYKLIRIFVLACLTLIQYINLIDAINAIVAIKNGYIFDEYKFGLYMTLRYLFPKPSLFMCISLQLSRICKYLFSYNAAEYAQYSLDVITGLWGYIIANAFKLWAFMEWYAILCNNKRSGEHLRTHLIMTKSMLKAHQVSDEVTSKIKHYYTFTLSKDCLIKKQNELYQYLPTSIRQEIKLASCYNYVKRIPYFDEWPYEMVADLTYMLKEEIYLVNDVIVSKWTPGEGLMILNEGVLAVYSSDDMEVGHLINGDYFGELSLVTDRELRTSDVVALTPCEILILHKKDFRTYMRSYPDIFFTLRQTMREKFYKFAEDYVPNKRKKETPRKVTRMFKSRVEPRLSQESGESPTMPRRPSSDSETTRDSESRRNSKNRVTWGKDNHRL